MSRLQLSFLSSDHLICPFSQQTSSIVCSTTHINFVEGVAEEEQRSAERQLGAGVRARLQPLVPGVFSKVEQLLQLQSPGPDTQAQQPQRDPEPAHRLADTTDAENQRVFRVQGAGQGSQAAGDADSRSGAERSQTERRRAGEGVMNGWSSGGL